MKIRALMAGVAVALTSPVAVADVPNAVIARYNTAAQTPGSKDLVPAAKALAEAAMASPEDETSALLAYEAAWKLCQPGDCASAIPAAEFVLTQPQTDGHPSPANRQLLLAYARWQVEPTKTARAALDAALEGAAGQTPSLLSVSAFQNRYIADLQAEHYRTGSVTAGAAADHFAQMQEELYKLWYDAALAEQVARFNHRQDVDILPDLARLYSGLWLKRHLMEDRPEWLNRQHYVSMAWMQAMQTFFESEEDGKIEIALAESILDEVRQNHTHPDGASDADTDRMPVCGGNLNRGPRPRYPRSAARRGYAGAVIVLLDIDESGDISPRIAASVPSEMFNEAVLKSLRPLKWRWEDPEPGEPACRKSAKGIVYPFHFLLQH